jgi:hypothetical protein|tara:strand:- start:1411 stop:1539 length:129 start_codon:yes stop_codon:yes gene_type:complete
MTTADGGAIPRKGGKVEAVFTGNIREGTPERRIPIEAAGIAE